MRMIMLIAYAIKDKLGGDNSCGLFAVFDGHGGRQVAEHCAERMPEEMKKESHQNPRGYVLDIEQVFLRVTLPYNSKR